MFLALLRAHFNPRYARAKMILSRAKNIFMPANVNSIVILKRHKIATDFASLPVASLTYHRLFLAIQINGSAADIDTDAGNSRRKRSFACDIGKRRMRRSCVIIPPPPPPPPTESPFTVLVADNLGFDGKYFFPNQTPNYNMSMYESSCLFWDEENQTWTGHGCRVRLDFGHHL